MSARIPVSILGATGTVGQRLVTLLDGHPRFEVVSLVASRSAGRAYGDLRTGELPASVAGTGGCSGDPPRRARGSPCLDPSVARDTEERFARAGVMVVQRVAAPPGGGCAARGFESTVITCALDAQERYPGGDRLQSELLDYRPGLALARPIALR